jgi:hypothetical protein
MNGKKYGMMLGAVAVVLLMTSNAFAVTTHIDSNVKITNKQLKQLNDAYNCKDFKDDKDFKILLEQSIQLVNTKGVVNSNDIQKIISDNNLNIAGVYFTRHIYTGPSTSDWAWSFNSGSCMGFGLFFHYYRPFYWGLPLYWSADTTSWPGDPIEVHVGPDTYTYPHQGFVCSYFGMACSHWTGMPIKIHFGICGRGQIIFVW